MLRFWLQALIAELQPQPGDLRRCLTLDQEEAERQLELDRLAWEAWADEPIEPFLTIRYIPAVYGVREVPKAFCTPRDTAENIAWASLFFLAPLGCIYYPIEILPEFLQIIAKGLPLVHIFEEMRNILMTGTVDYGNILKSIVISIVYFCLGILVFYISYYGAKKRGTLINMGE